MHAESAGPPECFQVTGDGGLIIPPYSVPTALIFLTSISCSFALRSGFATDKPGKLMSRLGIACYGIGGFGSCATAQIAGGQGRRGGGWGEVPLPLPDRQR